LRFSCPARRSEFYSPPRAGAPARTKRSPVRAPEQPLVRRLPRATLDQRGVAVPGRARGL